MRANIPAALNASYTRIKQLVITVNMSSITDQSVSNEFFLWAPICLYKQKIHLVARTWQST